MSGDQKFAWLLQQYDSFSRSSILDTSTTTQLASSSSPVYLTVEPSEARGTVPNFSTLFTPNRAKLSMSSPGTSSATSSMTSSSTSVVRRSGQSLFDEYFEFCNSVGKSRRVLLRSVATENELRMADVQLWRGVTRSVPLESATSTTSLDIANTQTSPVEYRHASSQPSLFSLINVQSIDNINLISKQQSSPRPTPLPAASEIVSTVFTENLQREVPISSKQAASPSTSASSLSCCSSDSESSSSSSASYPTSEGDESSDDEAQTVPCTWPATSPMMCALETQCNIATDLELPQNCCV